MIWLATIKRYWQAGLLLLASLGASLLTFFAMRSGTKRKERKELEAKLDHAIDVMEKDKQIDRERKSRSAEMANDVEKVRDSLRNPDDWD